MKRLFLLFALIIICTVGFAHSNATDTVETSMPIYNKEIVRKCSILDIEGKNCFDVLVTIKSISPSVYSVRSDYRVNVTVKDASGSKIWKHTFKNAYLYVFSNGCVHVGYPKFRQLIIEKFFDTGNWYGIIREYEGVYN